MNHSELAKQLSQFDYKYTPKKAFLDFYGTFWQTNYVWQTYKDLIPREAIELFRLNKDIEINYVLLYNKQTGMHTDHNFRKANLLMLISDNSCMIEHHNNDQYNTVTMHQGDLFCLDTSKPHNAINLTDEPSLFFSVSRLMDYQQLSEFYSSLLNP